MAARSNKFRLLVGVPTLVAAVFQPQVSSGGPVWTFVDASEMANVAVTHSNDAVPGTPTERAGGGVAAGDYDRDGNIDLYVITGPSGQNALLHNQGDGTFQDATSAAGVGLFGTHGSGPLFFDFDGDGWLDLFVGGTDGSAPVLFRNREGRHFVDVTQDAQLLEVGSVISASAGDYNGDGYPDLFLSHWGADATLCHLFENVRGERFQCADQSAHVEPFSSDLFDRAFSANFVDIDQDGRQDLLVASDFGTSRVLRNQGGYFETWASPVISDENGMGSAIGDYDGDGSLDWFVSSIWDSDGITEGNWGTSGNRMYRNRGDGTFEDRTDSAGVRQGDWGWAACFADLNHDGNLDLVHVNGWPQGSAQFRNTPARLFVGSSEGAFAERAAELGFIEQNNGRGLVCFDYDGDGDVDLFVMNNGARAHLWRNDGATALGNHLWVRLEGNAPNTQALGAVVRVRTGKARQIRPVRAGSNYVSQDSTEVHFGLGAAAVVDELRVTWPDGHESALSNLRANQRLVVHEEPVARYRPSGGCSMSAPWSR
ncbi:MAG TPA: CRTAC1 family protein [Polyangiaceae bacterium]|nr:CRTAC1 family protein [Polyangiaceae bacterium]